MTEICRFLFFTEISSYFLGESERNFGEFLIKGGVLIFNSPVVTEYRILLMTTVGGRVGVC